MQHRSLRLLLPLALAASTSAWALPATTLDWVQRTGTTDGVSVVEVWLRLTVDPLASGPLYLDGAQTSFDAGDYALLSDFASIDGVSNGGSAACSTTFWPEAPLNACFDPASPWKFDFGYTPDSFFQPQDPLLPGQSRDYLFGTFTPQNGPVANGLYSFSNASLQFYVQGKDANGGDLFRSLNIGDTCSGYLAECAFDREVIGSVPEPGSYGLMALGLAGLLWRRRATR